MRLELYLFVAGVTVSQSEFAVISTAAGTYGMNVTICVACVRVGVIIRLIVLIVGVCLLDVSSQPITTGCALHELLRRFREVSITTLECGANMVKGNAFGHEGISLGLARWKLGVGGGVVMLGSVLLYTAHTE
jgi:hypothetical protein